MSLRNPTSFFFFCFFFFFFCFFFFFFFCFFFFFFCVPQLYVWGSPFWVRFLRM